VYGDAKNLFANLGQMSEDLKVISGKIRAGEGTLGALVVDPSVYDDLRTVLGNVKRNKILQELVRMTVSNTGSMDKVGRPPDGKPPGEAAAAPAPGPRQRRGAGRREMTAPGQPVRARAGRLLGLGARSAFAFPGLVLGVASTLAAAALARAVVFPALTFASD